MQLRKSSKKQAKIKLALQGCAGSGKTYSALLLAYGLCGDWSKIAVIDSENNSADLYAHLGQYNVLPLEGKYDSMSQCWDNLLEYHACLPGNSFTNWQKVTPRMTSLIQMILGVNCHVISTMRCKQDYVLSEKNGKMVPEKVGLKAVMRDGIDYEYTIVFDINMKHQAVASKDRTNLFANKPEFTITPTTGRIILDWCNDGVTLEMIKAEISKAETIEQLNSVYQQFPEWNQQLLSNFTNRKNELLQPKEEAHPINYQPNFTRVNHADRTINFATTACQ